MPQTEILNASDMNAYVVDNNMYIYCTSIQLCMYFFIRLEYIRTYAHTCIHTNIHVYKKQHINSGIFVVGQAAWLQKTL